MLDVRADVVDVCTRHAALQVSGQLCRTLGRPVRRTGASNRRYGLPGIIPKRSLLRSLHRRPVLTVPLRRAANHSHIHERQARASHQVLRVQGRAENSGH